MWDKISEGSQVGFFFPWEKADASILQNILGGFSSL